LREDGTAHSETAVDPARSVIERMHRGEGNWLRAVALAGVLMAVTASNAGAAKMPVKPQDRAATDAYLTAEYEYVKAVAASTTASMSAGEALAKRLGGECPGVLAGAPGKRTGPPKVAPSARREGEENREDKQRNDLQQELSVVWSLAVDEPYRDAALVKARVQRSLQWSDPTVTHFVQADAVLEEQGLQHEAPAVCADMRAWVASGYRTLSPATKTFIREREIELTTAYGYLQRGNLAEAFSDPLSPYEGPHEKALMRAIVKLELEKFKIVKPLEGIYTGLRTALGFTPIKKIPLNTGPPKGSLVIGKGKTAAGGNYTVRLEPRHSRPKGPLSLDCEPTVTIETSSGDQSGSLFKISGSSEACLSRSHPESAKVECEEGLVTVEVQTLPSARTVSLRLSDGRRIVSRVSLVPARKGGPFGFYYQAVRGPSPIPVSVSELDAHGRVLRTVKLKRVLECTKNPIHYLPGGRRTLARASVPEGPKFTIVGEHYRREGHTYSEIELDIPQGRAFGFGPGPGGGEGVSISVGNMGPGRGRGSSRFSRQMETSCEPHEYAIVYGLLKSPHDTVLARVAGVLQPLRRVPIPANLHAGGVLAYIVLSSVPTELVVRTPSGKTVETENLTKLARETAEKCQGESEGPAPAPS
jgi:hypothetical protein